MKINTNISSMSAIRSLDNTSKALSRALERLASGKRINRAGDDASGLAISNGLESQIRGMNVTSRNINNGLSLLNVADGALQAQTDLIARLKELAVQSANGTLGNEQRSAINLEATKLISEYQRINDQTEFNGVKLFQLKNSNFDIQIGTQKNQSIQFSLTRIDIPNFADTTEVQGSGMFSLASSVNSQGTWWNGPSSGVGDFNNDGKLDFIDRHTIFLGQGNGTFGAGTMMDVDGPSSAPADLNEDGNLDIVSSASITLGNGNGTFKASTALGPAANRATAGDLNADGHIDIIRSSVGTNAIYVLLGNGDGTFAAPVTYGISQARDVQIADLDSDGNMDLVAVGSAFQGNHVLWGDGTGSFGSQTDLNGGTGGNLSQVADFNNDGHLDVMASQAGAFMKLYFGNGDRTFSAVTTVATGSYNVGDNFRAADINGDGNMDFIAGENLSGTMTTYFGNGDGTFRTGTSITVAITDGVDIGDFNGDGVIDAIARQQFQSSLYLQSTTSIVTPGARLSLATQSGSQDALSILSSLSESLLAQRAQIGAYQNRLEYAANNNMKTVENLSQAKSTILDSDVAVETAELIRNQILQQAGVGVLGQANTSLQIALELLRNI